MAQLSTGNRHGKRSGITTSVLIFEEKTLTISSLPMMPLFYGVKQYRLLWHYTRKSTFSIGLIPMDYDMALEKYDEREC